MSKKYVFKVENGEITDVKDFILMCARNFDACSHMRSADLSEKPKLMEVSDYYLKKINIAKEKLDKYIKMTADEWDYSLREWIFDKNEEIAKLRIYDTNRKERCYTMLDKVYEWDCPTEEHFELKSFAVSQLKKSIERDYGCEYIRALEKEDIPDIEEYIESKMNGVLNEIQYYTKCHNEEIKNVNECNKWIVDLYNSFK